MKALSPTDIAAVLGVIISILASYMPGFSDWYAKLSGTSKRLVMLGGGLVIVAGAFALSCAGLGNFFACTWLGAAEALKVFIAFMVANQAAYLVSPKKSLY